MSTYYCMFCLNGATRVFRVETYLALPFRITSMASLILKNPPPEIFVKDRWDTGELYPVDVVVAWVEMQQRRATTP